MRLTPMLAVLSACVPEALALEPPAPSAPTAVHAAAIEQSDAPRPVKALGLLASKTERRLSFLTGGVIAEVLVGEGQTVRRGQRLAQLAMPQIDAQVSAARNAFDKTSRDLARVAELRKAGVTTVEQLENATTARDVAQAQLSAVEFSREHATITAPASGRIARRLAEAGELVGAGTPVLVLAASEGGWVVRAGVPDRDVVRLTLGDPALVRFDAFGTRALAAKLTELASASSPTTGLFEVELQLVDPPPAALTGLMGKVEITPTLREPAAWIPIEAILDADGDRASVFAVRDGRAVRLLLTTARVDGAKVAVSSGLEGHDRVITLGRTKVTDGAPVVVVSDAEARR